MGLLHANGVIDATALTDWMFSAAAARLSTSQHPWQCLYDALGRIVRARDYAWGEPTTARVEPVADEAEGPDLDALEQKYQRAVQRQKEVFLAVFEQFNDALADHIIRTKQNGAECSVLTDSWLRISVGRFRQTGACRLGRGSVGGQ